MKISHEFDCYPIIKNLYINKKWVFKRLELKTFPDIWVGKKNSYYWIEVKVYRGKKKLKNIDLMKDLSWRPGQLLFRKEITEYCNNHYKLYVFTIDGNFKVF